MWQHGRTNFVRQNHRNTFHVISHLEEKTLLRLPLKSFFFQIKNNDKQTKTDVFKWFNLSKKKSKKTFFPHFHHFTNSDIYTGGPGYNHTTIAASNTQLLFAHLQYQYIPTTQTVRRLHTYIPCWINTIYS